MRGAGRRCRDRPLTAVHACVLRPSLTDEEERAHDIPAPVVHAIGEHHTAAFERMVAGGLAGACAKTAIAPGDRIKILYQVRVPCGAVPQV